MRVTAAVMSNVGSNAAKTFGAALTTGVVALAVNKACHAYFDISQDIRKTSSGVIRLLAFISGTAVGLYCLNHIHVVVMDRDNAFIFAHTPAVMAALYCAIIAHSTSMSPDKRTSVLYAAVSALALSTRFVASFGQTALIPAIGIGAAVGSYL
jgi:hypothetical protein